MSLNATVMTAEEVRKGFRARGVTIAAWARDRGFNYRLVQKVLSGEAKCFYGESHRIAIELGLKASPVSDQPVAA
jgi:gp16 family phage-associated protein